MKVLVACEESQAVCKAFRAKGHEAYSCDIIECSGGHPEWHIMQDVLQILNPQMQLKGLSHEYYGIKPFYTMDGKIHFIHGKWDMIIAFPPCFVAGTKVMTYDGIKSIEDIKVGDLVLTHKGRYRPVTEVMQKVATKTALIKAKNMGYIECTPNHPFYVQNIGLNNNGLLDRDFKIDNFMWSPPTEFKSIKEYPNLQSSRYIEKTYLTTVTDITEVIPDYNGIKIKVNKYAEKTVKDLKIEDINLWYLIGRWLGDGWFYHKKINGEKRLYGINICCNKKETEELKEKIQSSGYKYCLIEEQTANKFQIYNQELATFLTQFGVSGASSKIVPGFVTRLPQNLALSFLQGYLDADGTCNDKGQWRYHTVSKDLAYGIKYMINKYYKVSCFIRQNKNRDVIQGRTCNVKDIYEGIFTLKYNNHSKFIRKDNYILAPFDNIEYIDKEILVYNLSVEEDESYTANGVVVHNCTHLTNSGARFFEQKRADGRQREGIEFFCQFLIADCDKIVIENPVGIINGKYIQQWFPDLCEKYGLPRKPTQKIQPYEFGHPVRKTTCLWLKGVEPLRATNIVEPDLVTYINKDGVATTYSEYMVRGFKGQDRAKVRSKTFEGVAEAMADQWG